MNNLYIVSTPIGNLQDITIRAIKTLSNVDYILTENVVKTKLMLQELEKRHPELIENSKKVNFEQFNEYIENENLYKFLHLLEEGYEVALVSEAGTPLLSDPGYKLIRTAIQKGINIVEVPGPSAITSALVVSGLPTDKFLFLGFLPRTKGKKVKFLDQIKNKFYEEKELSPTIIFFESPHRLIETLESVYEIFGDINIVLARELTKKFEEVIREKVNLVLERFKKQPPKGEFTILFNLKHQA